MYYKMYLGRALQSSVCLHVLQNFESNSDVFILMKSLTGNFQVKTQSFRGVRGQLTLVVSLVPFIDWTDPQSPVIGIPI